MPAIDVLDELFLAVPVARIAAAVHEESSWPVWWPRLRLSVVEDRGRAGVRWLVAGEFTGSTEIWIEPCHDGAIVHYYLRVDPRSGRPSPRTGPRLAAEGKRVLWALKDRLESGRVTGEPVQ